MKNRINEINTMNCGEKAKIINIYNGKIDIEFEDGTIVKNKFYYDFKHGRIKNPNCKTIFGIGYIGIGIYKTKNNDKNKMSKEYMAWYEMMRRCYGYDKENRNPTYENCTVCEEWHNFQNFAKWFNENIWDEKITLIPDKDILNHNYNNKNKIYSPDTCILVDNRINNLFTKCDKVRSKYGIGVRKQRKKYKVNLSMFKSKWENFGIYDTPEEAFKVYKIEKEKYIKQVADDYKNKYEKFPKKII